MARQKFSSFSRFSAGVLIFNLGVILWGAFVRASRSGAGCGNHWPLCNGQVLPQSPRLETLIEFSHRLSSGLSLLSVIALFAWARRAFPRGHIVRKGAGASLFLICTEALIGAALVLFGWVVNNPSAARAGSISLHLVNTLFLVASLTLTWRWSLGDRDSQPAFSTRAAGAYLAAGAIFAFVGISGAITALGDMLFPSASLRQGLQRDFSMESSFLLRLRVFHPVLAVLLAAGLWILFAQARDRGVAPKLALAGMAGVVLQLALGLLNLLLMAPLGIQLTHLLVADLVWVTLVLVGEATLSAEGAT